MRLIVQDDRIAATATDDYAGPETWRPAPENFDLARLAEYRDIDGALIIPPPTLEDLKAARGALVNALMVTTTAGNTFDGNEDAQNRMSRALNGMDDGDVTPWVLADSTLVNVDKTELREALRRAGIAMTKIWMEPYQ